jgi:hypothetical protein
VGTVTTSVSPGTSLSTGANVLPNMRWATHSNNLYVNLQPDTNPMTVDLATRSGTWSSINSGYGGSTPLLNIFTLSTCHGSAPVNASYGYAVLPGMSASNAQSATSTLLSSLFIPANNDRVQAVQSESSNGTVNVVVTHVVFWAPGSVEWGSDAAWPIAVAVNRAVVLTMVRARLPSGGLGDVEIAVSSTDKSSGTVTVTLTGEQFAGTQVCFGTVH